MKYVLSLGLLLVGGALASGACTQSDSKGSTNRDRNPSGSGGTTTSGTGNTGGSANGTGGTGGYDTTGSGGTGGYDATGGSAGEGGYNAAGAAGQNGTDASDGSGGSGGTGGDFCDGDDELQDLPNCDDLPYSAATCNDEPPRGLTVCEQYAQNATDEAFETMFNCLNELDLDCGEDFPQVAGINKCLQEAPFETCESELAVEKCDLFGCDAIDHDVCVAFLSSFTDDGVQSVIDCANELTQTPSGSPWGGSSDVVACEDAFVQCFAGTL